MADTMFGHERPAQSVPELQEQIRHMRDNLGPGAAAKVITGVEVGAQKTPIAHGLGKRPRAIFVIPYSDERVWRADPPDTSRAYLAASAPVTCDLLVIP